MVCLGTEVFLRRDTVLDKWSPSFEGIGLQFLVCLTLEVEETTIL